MERMALRARIGAGSEDGLQIGISDLAVVAGDGGPALYATTGRNGGVTGYRLTEGRSAQAVEERYFGPGIAGAVTGELTEAGDRLIVGGAGGALTGYALQGTGGLGGALRLEGVAGAAGAMAAGAGGHLYMAAEGGAIGCYRATGTGYARQGEAGGHGLEVADMATLELGGQMHLFAACGAARGVVAFSAEAGTGLLRAEGSMGAEKGLGVMRPVAIEAVEVGGTGYVILASAPDRGEGGALSVMRVTAAGSLVPTDHVLDTLETRFGQVQSLISVQAEGRTYVVAGGGDDGLSLFALLPGGRLAHLESLADSDATGLDGVTALAAAQVGGELQVFAAAGGETGLTQFAVSLAAQGVERQAGAAGGALAGTARDDILQGGAGADSLQGGAGDDILADGAGADRMWGGAGADLFLLAADGAADRIDGFVPGVDRLDLSGWPMFYGADQLTVQDRSWGAKVRFAGETLELRRAGGGTITAEEVAASLAAGPDRPPLGVAREAAGGAGHDRLEGHWGTDYMEGFAGHDRLFGLEGDDKLFGGAGCDMLFGGEGGDTVEGGNGADRAWLGPGADLYRDTAQSGEFGRDRVYSGLGNDTVETGGGADELHGIDGHDLLRGGAGDDTIYGGSGHDTLEGGAGADVVRGGNGQDLARLGDGADVFFDTIQGGPLGRDTVRAGAGDDTVEGGNGGDAFYGEAGDDLIRGRYGDDLIHGGAGFDSLDAGPGRDTVHGGDGRDAVWMGPGADLFLDSGQGGDPGRDTVYAGLGDDTVEGGGGADVFHGIDGHDVLRGRLGDDTLFGGRGWDRLEGGAGADRLQGGPGNDLLTGGAGADVFVFGPGAGEDRVTDFDPAADLLRIEGTGGGFAGLGLTDAAGGAWVEYGAGRVWLAGVAAAELDAGDVLFG